MSDIFAQDSIKKDALFSTNSSKPVHLAKVEVNGAQDYSNEYVSSLIQPLLKSNVYTVQSLFDSISETEKTIASSNAAFRNVKILIDQEKAPITQQQQLLLATKLIVNLTPININKAKLTAHTNNHGADLFLSYVNNNYYGSGENVALIGSFNNDLSNGYATANVLVPFSKAYANYSLLLNATGSRFGSTVNNPAFNEDYKQVIVGVNRNGFVPKTSIALSVFNGLAIAQNKIYNAATKSGEVSNAPLEGISAKTSLVSTIKLQHLKTISDVLFPVSGFEWAFSNEYAAPQLNNNAPERQSWKSIFSSNYFLTLGPKSHFLTFNVASSLGNLHNLGSSSSSSYIPDKFTHGSIIPATTTSAASAITIPTTTTNNNLWYENANANSRVDGNAFLDNTVRVFAKLPIFNNFIHDRNTILRLQFFLNSSKIFANFANLAESASKTLGGNFDSVANEYANTAGIGLFYRSAYGAADFGYNVPLSSATGYVNPNYKPGFQFSASVSFA